MPNELIDLRGNTRSVLVDQFSMKQLHGTLEIEILHTGMQLVVHSVRDLEAASAEQTAIFRLFNLIKFKVTVIIQVTKA